MSEQSKRRLGLASPSAQSLLLAATFALPAIFPNQLGWLMQFLAIPVCYNLRIFGPRGGIIIGNAVVLAGGIGFVAHFFLQYALLPSLILTITMVLLGYSLFRSARRAEDAAVAGGKGIVVLGSSWLALGLVYGLSKDVNLYVELQNSLIARLDDLFELNKSALPADELLNLKIIIDDLKKIFHHYLPGLLGAGLVTTVWLNQVITNSLLHRFHPELAPWPKYSRWQLPDQFVWTFIIAGVIYVLGKNGWQDIGLNLLIVICAVYFLQGLAIFSHFIKKWKVPILLGALLFVIIGVHSMGLTLAILGLADVWIDFRQLQQNNQPS